MPAPQQLAKSQPAPQYPVAPPSANADTDQHDEENRIAEQDRRRIAADAEERLQRKLLLRRSRAQRGLPATAESSPATAGSSPATAGSSPTAIKESVSGRKGKSGEKNEPSASSDRVADWISEAFAVDAHGDWMNSQGSNSSANIAAAFETWRRWLMVAWKHQMEDDQMQIVTAAVRSKRLSRTWMRLLAAREAKWARDEDWHRIRGKGDAAAPGFRLRRACVVWRAEAFARSRLAGKKATAIYEKRAKRRIIRVWRRAARIGAQRRHVGLHNVRSQIHALLHSAPSPL